MIIIGTVEEIEQVLNASILGMCINCDTGCRGNCTRECAEAHGVEFEVIENEPA